MTLTPGQFILNQDRDVPILSFLWKWKLATTAAIAAKFFPNRSPTCSYNRLVRIKKYGLIEQRCNSKGEAFYWTLTKKGFAAIQSDIPLLQEEGFKSEHLDHDALVTAFHIGEWLLGSPEGALFFSEQQLRRIDSSEYPAWVPQSEQHRPDGYWGFSSNGPVIPIALEVELNRKSSDAYEDIGDFYSEQVKIHRVLWLVKSKAVASRIQADIERRSKTRTKIHNYVRIKDFRKNCWSAPIILGPEQQKTVSTLLYDLAGNPLRKPCERAVTSQASPLLDIKKSYIKSVASRSRADS